MNELAPLVAVLVMFLAVRWLWRWLTVAGCDGYDAELRPTCEHPEWEPWESVRVCVWCGEIDWTEANE